LRRAEPIEYCAHLLPIAPAGAGPAFARDGLLVAGDAARLANLSHYKELTNLATASGEAAGEAAADAIDAGDTSARGLAGYERRLAAGFVLRDARKYAGLAELMERDPDLLRRYPRALTDALLEHFAVSERPKDDAERATLAAFNRAVKPAQLRKDLSAILEASGFSLTHAIGALAGNGIAGKSMRGMMRMMGSEGKSK
jgi:electron transfer flavoprotein-quinone oxidoreductase